MMLRRLPRWPVVWSFPAGLSAPRHRANGLPPALWRGCRGVATKESHPREWAIFKHIDKDGDGSITTAEINRMCQNYDAVEHAAVVNQVMDKAGRGYVTFPEFVEGFKAVAMVRKAARLKHWHRCYGLGVAGNVAGHMTQAGEADEPEDGAHHQEMPPAIFTFYAPHPHTIDANQDEVLERLQQFPVTQSVIDFPNLEGSGNVQVEPEMGLYVDVVYARDGASVERLVPRRVAAFNDCSIRKLDGSEKLSEKKNWGFGSKGISLRSFRVDSISKGTLVDKLVLVSFVKRGAGVYQYSIAAPARNYLLFHDPLLDWIVDRINNQGDTGKWEEIFKRLVASDFPTSMWIALGAGEYTEWGAENFLQKADETLVLVYNEDYFPSGPSLEQVDHMFEDRDAPDGIIALHQTFV